MACPHVAGAAALLSSAHPNLSPLSLKASLLNSVDVIPALAGTSVTGGRLNVSRAIQTPTICAFSLNQSGQSFTAAGGNGSVNMLSPANCGWEAKSNATWLTVNTGLVGAGNGAISFTVGVNSTSAPRAGTITIGGQVYTVTQNGPAAIPLMTINDVTAQEGSTGVRPFNFTVTLSNAYTQPVTVNYNTLNGRAQGGQDFQFIRNETLAFAPGETSKTVTVNVFGDILTEFDEDFTLNLEGAVNANLTDSSGVATISNDDFNGSVYAFSAANYTARESEGQITINILRGGETVLFTGTVGYDTQDNFAFVDCAQTTSAAQQRCDYTATHGAISYPLGNELQTITLPLNDDLYVEGTETFTIRLDNPAGSFQDTATVTIIDDDSAVTTPFGDPNIAQLSGGQQAPANSSTANGIGAVSVFASQTLLFVKLNFSGLSSSQTAAHIHGSSHVGVNAPILFNLGAGQIDNMVFSLTQNQLADLQKGLLYFDVHTTNFPGGEIRGQILPNQLESARFFVRQQYHDFLNRVPDQAGFDFWTGQIVTTCGADLACIHRRRLDVSAAFFIEQEFQESGAFVFRLYKAAFGEQPLYRPAYSAFVPDRARVVGGANLAQGKLAFANLFANRSDFTTRYPASMTPAQLVDAVLLTVQQGAGVSFTAGERAAFINTINATGRGAFIRDLGDGATFKNAVFNRAFVLTQYFGYLKRDPDQGGYDFWLNILNQQPNNFRGMVCAFVTASEYQTRFASISTRSNQDCQ